MSSPFKEALQNDIKKTFLNTEEFSEIHSINKREMPAMLDDVEANEREVKYIGYGNNGQYVQKRLLYVASEDYGAMPSIGNALNLDGAIYRIFDVSEECGIYAITLEANKNGSYRS